MKKTLKNFKTPDTESGENRYENKHILDDIMLSKKNMIVKGWNYFIRQYEKAKLRDWSEGTIIDGRGGPAWGISALTCEGNWYHNIELVGTYRNYEFYEAPDGTAIFKGLCVEEFTNWDEMCEIQGENYTDPGQYPDTYKEHIKWWEDMKKRQFNKRSDVCHIPAVQREGNKTSSKHRR